MLAQLGWNVIEIERAEEIGLLLASHLALRTGQLVFVEFEPILLRPSAHGYIVFLAAREVVQRKRKLFIPNHA